MSEMLLNELIESLESLMADRNPFFREDGGAKMFRHDYEVLERTVRLLRGLLNQKRTVVKCHRKKQMHKSASKTSPAFGERR